MYNPTPPKKINTLQQTIEFCFVKLNLLSQASTPENIFVYSEAYLHKTVSFLFPLRWDRITTTILCFSQYFERRISFLSTLVLGDDLGKCHQNRNQVGETASDAAFLKQFQTSTASV